MNATPIFKKMKIVFFESGAELKERDFDLPLYEEQCNV
jgi:hypothetical protein